MRLFKRKPEFDAEVRRLIAELVPPGTAVTEIDDDSIQLGSVVLGLGNLRAKWNRLEEDEQLPWLEDTLPALVNPPEIPGRLVTTKPLRPGIRPRSTLEAARLANLSNEIQPVSPHARPLIPFRPFGGDLVSVLLWDAPTTMSMVNQAQLDEWDARFDDLLAVAIDNLEDELQGGWNAIDNRVWTSQNEDDYDGARMLIPGYLDQTNLAGELVIINPNRNLLIVTAVDDAEGIRMACELALDELDAPSPVSFQPLVGRNEEWRALVLPESHPAYTEWQRLNTLHNEMNYTALRDPLSQLVGDDLHLAPLRIGESPDGTYLSFCTWTAGVPSLLPRADMIELVSDQNELVTVDWETVQHEVGTILEPTDHYPELWRVMNFPSTADLARLRDRSTEL